MYKKSDMKYESCQEFTSTDRSSSVTASRTLRQNGHASVDKPHNHLAIYKIKLELYPMQRNEFLYWEYIKKFIIEIYHVRSSLS